MPILNENLNTSSAELSKLPSEEGTTTVTTNLGNLKTALRSALTEASQNTAANRLKAMSGFVEGGAAPSVIQAAVGLAQKGLSSTKENAFNDIMTGYKDATDAKQKELDRINELRAEYGSLVPNNVTDLKTALDLIAPNVDKENKLRLQQLADDQASDNDIESWADSYSKGEVTITSVPSAIRTAVKVRADKIMEELETEAKQEYKDKISFRLEKKTTNFETERGTVLADGNLSVAEQREILDYIDSLEATQKETKSKEGGGFIQGGLNILKSVNPALRGK